MGKDIDVHNTQTLLVTPNGIIPCELAENSNTVLCPSCHQPPFVSEMPTDTHVYFVCSTEGCENMMVIDTNTKEQYQTIRQGGHL